jgi:hypothetical protein
MGSNSTLSSSGPAGGKWAKDTLRKWWNWLTRKSGGGKPADDGDECAKDQKYWQAVIEQYLEGYAKSSEVDRRFMDREQKPIINQRIADHNQRCPNHQVSFL